MSARWISVLLLMACGVGAIPRPDTKTALRGLARLPRAEFRVSLDFDADRGFAALRSGRESSTNLLNVAAEGMDSGDATRARRNLQRAVDIFRKRLDSEPGNSQMRLELASALHGVGRQAEAETILREAVRMAPRSLTNWLSFSAFLEARGWEIAGNLSNWRGRRAYAELCHAVIMRELSTETANRAAEYFEDGLRAAEEATRLEEKSANAQHRLALALASKECFEALRLRMRSRDEAGPLVESMIFSPNALPAFEKASELDPESPVRVATALLWRGLSKASEKRIAVGELLRRSVWDGMAAEDRARIEVGLVKLELMGTSSKAALSYQALGTLRFVLRGDMRQAVDDLQNAAAIEPDAEQVWETLSAALLRVQDYSGLAAACEMRALARPNARNRFLVAKAYEKLGEYERVEEELLTALAVNVNDFTANVGMANLLMRSSNDDEIPPRVRQSLINAERAIRGTSNGHQLIELALAQSIYHGLTDELERAREILKAALAYSKDHPDVTAALNVIGY